MELFLFYLSAGICAVSTAMVITGVNALHSLLYLIVSLLAAAFIFYLLGAYFAALLEVIIYAGAIMVLFVFVVMMLNLGRQTIEQEKSWLNAKMWIGPSLLAALLLLELGYLFAQGQGTAIGQQVSAKQVGIALFGPYLLAVELASMLLLAGLVGAYHLGRPLERP